MGEEEIENFPLRIFIFFLKGKNLSLRDIFHHIWSVKLFLYKFHGTYFPIFKSKELPSFF